MNISRPRHLLYRSATVLGDLSAARRGPAAMGKRLVRKRAHRVTGGATQRVLRRVGL